MKKFIVLTLVLCMAPLASAALSIGVEGDPDPVDSEITIAPSDTLLLDIRSDGTDYNVAFMLIVDNAVGTITGGSDGLEHIQIYPPSYFYYFPPNTNGIAGALEGFDPISGIIVDQIDFHCESPADALIELWVKDIDIGVWSLADTVTIHQPEPMTMALLGLGGLFLRRRK